MAAYGGAFIFFLALFTGGEYFSPESASSREVGAISSVRMFAET
jgi:hypothetical protein